MAKAVRSRSKMLSNCYLFYLIAAAFVGITLLQTATQAQLEDDRDKPARQHYMLNRNQPRDDSTLTTDKTITTSKYDDNTGATDLETETLDDKTISPKAAVITTTISDANDEQDDTLNNTTLVINYSNLDFNLLSTTALPTLLAQKPRKMTEIDATTTTIVASQIAVNTREINISSSSSGGLQSAKLARSSSSSSSSSTSTIRVDDQIDNDFDINQKQESVVPETSDQVYEKNDKLRIAPAVWRTRVDVAEKTPPLKKEQNIFEVILKKKPYSKYWSVEQKWDEIYKRLVAIQDVVKNMASKTFMRDLEYYAEVSLSSKCAEDLRYIQEYQKNSTNFRWLLHMFDSIGKNDAGLLSGNMANLGHVIQCIKVRAPAKSSNDTFNERYFEKQTEKLGERFRGKYCLASIRPVLPERPKLVSRFSDLMDENLLSNISYMGESIAQLKRRNMQISIPDWVYSSMDRKHKRLDQVPFESELYQLLIEERNFMFNLPRMMGVCYPSSCTKEDIRLSLQKTMDDNHQVVDIEFDCEQEETDTWSWFNTTRLVVFVFLGLVASITFGVSLARYILVDKLNMKKRMLKDSKLAGWLGMLDMLSMDKCAGILFVKTRKASPIIDETKPENLRSTSIDALKGCLILLLVYCELVHLGCLPIPFIWSRWTDSMFPFYRSLTTQPFLNTQLWTEAFYIISAYLIAVKFLENHRPAIDQRMNLVSQPDFGKYISKRYVRLLLPMVAFISLNYVWPRLSNGFVMQDQVNKFLTPCDKHAWTNLLMFHNYNTLNETCLWPTHVSATFFQLHLISYPILSLLLYSLRSNIEVLGRGRVVNLLSRYSGFLVIFVLTIFGILYSAYSASNQELVVPFLIDYLDYDNYQRVIEWTILPTHNHLTSYMVGTAIAYIVVKKRADREVKLAEDSYLHLNESFESIRSSSTQELNLRPTYKTSLEVNKAIRSESNHLASVSENDVDSLESETSGSGFALSILSSGLAILAVIIALTASWFWNGLSQPMSSNQTFWFMIGTKLLFNISFGYLFYKHFSTRRNSINPWMLTRFLVPIGRMSLTVFYVSWLVIWFDLLTSLYQWHPSHYFILEKFNEIIFMTLILSMFVYGSFEGMVKIIHYTKQVERLKQFPSNVRDLNVYGFDYFFEPTIDGNEKCVFEKYNSTKVPVMSIGKLTSRYSANREEQSVTMKVLDNDKSIGNNKFVMLDGKGSTAGQLDSCDSSTQRLQADKRLKSYVRHTVEGKPSGSSSGGDEVDSNNKHLSIVDQYKLNAELRANYSFASIGLYESANATDDLAHPPSDPQLSPALTERRR